MTLRFYVGAGLLALALVVAVAVGWSFPLDSFLGLIYKARLGNAAAKIALTVDTIAIIAFCVGSRMITGGRE